MNGLDEPLFMAVSKPLLTEFGIHHRLQSCGKFLIGSLRMSTHEKVVSRAGLSKQNESHYVKEHEKLCPKIEVRSCMHFCLGLLVPLERCEIRGQ